MSDKVDPFHAMPRWLSSIAHAPDAPDSARFAMKMSTIIDFMKGTTLPALILIYIYFSQYHVISRDAFVYIGLHGTYGMLWVCKSLFGFGDKRWSVRKPLWYCGILANGLALYWLPMIILCSRKPGEFMYEASGWWTTLCVVLFGTGVFWHFVSDVHKTVFLEYRSKLPESDRKNILSEKLWARCRNPNYFGELLIYASFCLLPRHWGPILWLAVMVWGYWYPSMLQKEKSMSRHGKEWVEYKEKTYFFIPYVW